MHWLRLFPIWHFELRHYVTGLQSDDSKPLIIDNINESMRKMIWLPSIPYHIASVVNHNQLAWVHRNDENMRSYFYQFSTNETSLMFGEIVRLTHRHKVHGGQYLQWSKK